MSKSDAENQITSSEEIIHAIGLLTDRQKVAVLAAMLGYKQREIATMLGTNQSAASRLLERGKVLILGTRNKQNKL